MKLLFRENKGTTALVVKAEALAAAAKSSYSRETYLESRAGPSQPTLA